MEKPTWQRCEALMKHYPWMDYLMAETLLTLDDKGTLRSTIVETEDLLKDSETKTNGEKNGSVIVTNDGEGE